MCEYVFEIGAGAPVCVCDRSCFVFCCVCMCVCALLLFMCMLLRTVFYLSVCFHSLCSYWRVDICDVFMHVVVGGVKDR